MSTKQEKLNKLEAFLHSEKGQRFFNFAYSIGAAIVIWGALFKILHLPGGSALLCIGMGTEIAMFILTAFDKPAKEYAWEQVFPELERKRHAEGADIERDEEEEETAYDEDGNPLPRASVAASGAGYAGPGFVGGGGASGGVIIGGGASPAPAGAASAAEEGGVAGVGIAGPGGVIIAGGGGGGLALPSDEQMEKMEKLTDATQDYLDRITGIAAQMSKLQETTAELNSVSAILLDSYKAITDNSATISESSQGYVESMADLNRNIAGLNTIYEIQLKSISSQLESIDRVNRGLKDIRDMYEKSARQSSRYCEETERMTRYMAQLNHIYEKMVTAMTINMYNPMMGPARREEDDFNPYGQNAPQSDNREEN